VTSFEAYVSDVIERQFEKLRMIGRRLETGRRSESYIYLQMGTLGEYIYFCMLGNTFYTTIFR